MLFSKEDITKYNVTELDEKSYIDLIDKIKKDHQGIFGPSLPDSEEEQFPSVCLIGFGRCGSNICLNVKSMLIKARKKDNEAEAQGTISETIMENIGTLADRLSIPLGPFGTRKDGLIKLYAEPMICVIDLDVDTYQRVKDEEQEYKKFIPIELDYEGGAGNVQVVGEYQARRMLTMSPDKIKTRNWDKAFRYLIDSLLLEINRTRLYFYIFSMGGGSGSGMSSEFGFSQRNAIRKRSMEAEKTLSLSTEQPVFSKNNIFSCAFGVLPEIPDIERMNDAVFLNSGRLICKCLSMLHQDNINASISSPWDCLLLVSNNTMHANLPNELSRAELERITNFYVAQQIFNLLSAQATAGDIQREDWEEFGIGDERIRLDPNDLQASLAGVNVMGFAREPIDRKEPILLSKLFVDSFKAPEVVKLNEMDSYIRGISVIPTETRRYKGFFENDEPVKKLSELPMFKKAVSIVVVVSVPNRYKIHASDISELQRQYTELFPNAKIRRYAIVKNVHSSVTLTTFIGGNSVILTRECIAFLFAYIRRCFCRDKAKEKTFFNKLADFILYLKAKDEGEAPSTKKQKVKNADDLLAEISKFMLDKERLDEFTAAPFERIQLRQEGIFRATNPANFVPIDNLLLTKEDVMQALHEIYNAYAYEQIRTQVPDP
jgi:hypothetical protein